MVLLLLQQQRRLALGAHADLLGGAEAADVALVLAAGDAEQWRVAALRDDAAEQRAHALAVCLVINKPIHPSQIKLNLITLLPDELRGRAIHIHMCVYT
jgi:predicted nicotinamide N-methyase